MSSDYSMLQSIRAAYGWPLPDETTQPALQAVGRDGECYVCGSNKRLVYGRPAMCEHCHGLVKRSKPIGTNSIRSARDKP